MFFASKALFCALAFRGGAARQHLQSEKKGLAADVVDVVGSLVQTGKVDKSAAALARVTMALKETPEAMAHLTDALNDVIEELQDTVKTTINVSFQQTQKELNDRMDNLVDATTTALGLKDVAYTDDSIYITCVEEEQAKKVLAEAAAKANDDAYYAIEEPCDRQENNKAFSWEPQVKPSTFTCNFMEGDCTSKLEAYEGDVNVTVLQALDTEVGQRVAFYNTAKTDCQNAHDLHDEKRRENEDAWAVFGDKQEECRGQNEKRELAMCGFGTSLQQKCRLVGEFNTLLVEINTPNGNVHSQPDRDGEWATTETTICMLQQVIDTGAVDENTLASCAAGKPFSTEVGELDLKEAELTQQTTSENFSCEETSITFTGKNWIIPPRHEHSRYYEDFDYHPELSLESGDDPFVFCSGSGAGQGGPGKGAPGKP